MTGSIGLLPTEWPGLRDRCRAESQAESQAETQAETQAGFEKKNFES